MSGYILLIILSSLWIWGFYAAFDSKHLLGRLASKLIAGLGTTFCRPLFLCPPCMSSVHGMVIGFIYFGVSLKVLPFLVCLCGLNFIIKTILFPEYEDVGLDKEAIQEEQ